MSAFVVTGPDWALSVQRLLEQFAATMLGDCGGAIWYRLVALSARYVRIWAPDVAVLLR